MLARTPAVAEVGAHRRSVPCTLEDRDGLDERRQRRVGLMGAAVGRVGARLAVEVGRDLGQQGRREPEVADGGAREAEVAAREVYELRHKRGAVVLPRRPGLEGCEVGIQETADGHERGPARGQHIVVHLDEVVGEAGSKGFAGSLVDQNVGEHSEVRTIARRAEDAQAGRLPGRCVHD
ncbi:MAG: hypothetical protein AAFQ43_15330, partial [Bacteroidota bacterium]